MDHVRPAGWRLAVRVRRSPARGPDRCRDRRGCPLSAAPLSPERNLSRHSRLTVGMAKQLTLDLGLPPPTYLRRDFMVAGGNQDALAWIDRWPDWPGPALALAGPAGCGKTHLAHIWAERAGAPILGAEALEGKGIAELSELVSRSPAIAVDN